MNESTSRSMVAMCSLGLEVKIVPGCRDSDKQKVASWNLCIYQRDERIAYLDVSIQKTTFRITAAFGLCRRARAERVDHSGNDRTGVCSPTSPLYHVFRFQCRGG